MIGLGSSTAQKVAGLLGGERGAAAVEFALIVPFLLFLFAGAFELIVGIMVDRQVSLVASTLADVTAQYTTISQSQQMPDILNASAQILAPYPTSGAAMVISLISVDGSGNATVTWSQTLNGTARTVGSTIAVPASLATPNTSLVLGEATYVYTPIIDFIHLGTIKLAASTYMIPRASTTINLAS